MENTMPFAQMISEMDSLTDRGEPKPFSLVFVTADVKRQTGGDIHIVSNRTVTMDMLRRQNKDSIFTETRAIKVVGKSQDGSDSPIFNAPGKQVEHRNPHHRENHTLNIMLLSSKEIRKVHPRLIKFFNDKEIIP